MARYVAEPQCKPGEKMCWVKREGGALVPGDTLVLRAREGSDDNAYVVTMEESFLGSESTVQGYRVRSYGIPYETYFIAVAEILPLQ